MAESEKRKASRKRYNDKMYSLKIQLPKDYRDILQNVRDDKNITLSSLIKDILDDYLVENGYF